jgi:hypothetical protein
MPEIPPTNELPAIERSRLYYVRIAATLFYVATFTMLVLFFPRWFPPIVAAVCSLVLIRAYWSRHPPRFSLRTLLIATTILGVALGLAVWAMK